MAVVLLAAAFGGAGSAVAQVSVGAAGPPPVADSLRSMVRGWLASPFRLTADDVESLSKPGGAVLWEMDTVGIAGVLSQVGRADPQVAAAIQGLLGRQFDSPRQGRMAIDTALSLGQAGDSIVVAPPPVVDDALRARPAPPDTSTALVDRLDRWQPVPPLAGDDGPPLPPETLRRLAPLLDKWFPDGHLFQTALRVTAGIQGAPASYPLRRILAVAREEPAALPSDSLLQPLAWTGDNCGCGVYEEGKNWEPEFYGIYPFWEAPQGIEGFADKDKIDLSMLTRIGYYGLTFDADGNVQDTLHWKTGRYPAGALPFRARHFSDFAVEADAHKVNVDLIVYQADWDWLPASLDESNSDLGDALENLSGQVVDLISPRLGDPMNLVKPFVSLGQSPRRTLGDGITFHFDFSSIEDWDRQDQLFDLLTDSTGIDFFGRVRRRLDERAGEDGRVFHLGLDYRLSLIVPLDCVAGEDHSAPPVGCGFYSMENLSRLQKDINLFLVDMTAVRGDPSLARASLQQRTDRLRESLETLDAVAAAGLVQKVIPLAAPESPTGMRDFFLVSDLSFRGVGSWSATSMAATNATLRATFLPGPRRWTDAVCERVCPVRWFLRVGVFALLIPLLVLWRVQTESVAGKRRKAWAIRVLVILAGLIGLLTLWCDPWWKERQATIVLLVGLLLLGAWVRDWVQEEWRRQYP